MGPIAEGLHGFAHARQRDPSSLRYAGMTDLGRYAGMEGLGEWQAWGALLG